MIISLVLGIIIFFIGCHYSSSLKSSKPTCQKAIAPMYSMKASPSPVETIPRKQITT